MPHKHLATYLNDHLAGAVTAIELLEYVAKAYADSAVQRVIDDVRVEVVKDRNVLEALMARLEIGESAPRKAAAWVAEKLAQAKLRLDDLQGGPLRLLEATEAISLGIEGKRSLWRSLSTAAQDVPELRSLDFDRLIKRAEEQRDRVEAVRLDAARAALAE